MLMKLHGAPFLRGFKQPAWAAWTYLSPALILFGIFWFYPTIMLVNDSLYRWDGFGPRRFIGLENYTELLNDPSFYQTLQNTLVFLMGTVPTSMAVGLILALLLQKQIVAKGVFRTIFFSPVVTSYVAAGLIFLWLLNYDYGVVNALLSRLGFDRIPWLMEQKTAMLAVITVTVWKDAGYNMILFLGGLNSIDPTYREAAALDGAGRWQIFKDITWPLLWPTTIFVLITRIIFTIRAFEQIYAMTRGGPSGATRVFVYYIYEKAFDNFQLGYASAAAVLLLAGVIGITLVQLKWVKI
jgi:multiple sugar transport system permease protein